MVPNFIGHNQFHNILRLFDAIIAYKHGICKLPHELPKDLFAVGWAECPHKKKKT